MYCSTCGNAVIDGLSFCNNCGARTSPEKDDQAGKPSGVFFYLLVSALVAIPIIGIGMIIGLLAVMKEEFHFSDEMIITITGMCFVLLLVSEGAIFWLLKNQIRVGGKPSKKGAKPNKNETSRLNEVVIKGLNEGQAPEFFEPLPSVVDGTTRNLTPVYRKPKNQGD